MISIFRELQGGVNFENAGSITSAVEMLREGDAVVSKHIEPGTNVLSGSEGQEAYQEPKGGPASEDVGTSKQLRYFVHKKSTPFQWFEDADTLCYQDDPLLDTGFT